MLKILLVETVHKTAVNLIHGLTDAGFSIDLVNNGVDGQHRALTYRYDLVILDIDLPGQDGWQVLRAIRTAGKEVLVMFLSGRCDVMDRVKGLELGADDYMVKPYAFSELLARVRALMRRSHKAINLERLRFADLELDLMRRRACRAGVRIDLTTREFSLLELLLRRQGEVLPRSLIISNVWNMNVDSDANVLDLAIWRLRAKVDGRFEPKLIHTVRGTGYVLKAKGQV